MKIKNFLQEYKLDTLDNLKYLNLKDIPYLINKYYLLKRLDKISLTDYMSSWKMVKNSKAFKQDFDLLEKFIEHPTFFLVSKEKFLDSFDLEEKDSLPYKKFLLKIMEEMEAYDWKSLEKYVTNDEIFLKYNILLNKNHTPFDDLPEELKKDPDICLHYLKNEITLLPKLKCDISENKDIATLALRDNLENIKYFSDRLFDNEDDLENILKYNEKAFVFCSDRIKNDPKVLLKLIKNNVSIFPLVPEKIQNNQSFRDEVFNQNEVAIIYMKEKREDDALMTAILEKIPRLLTYASANLKNNDELVSKILIDNPDLFEHASEKLRNNEEFAERAVRKSMWCYQYIGDELKNNIVFTKKMLDIDITPYFQGGELIKNNKEIFEKVFEDYPDKRDKTVLFVGKDLLKDEEILKKCIPYSKRIVVELFNFIKDKPDIREVILKHYPEQVQYYQIGVEEKIEHEIYSNQYYNDNALVEECRRKFYMEFFEEVIALNPQNIKFLEGKFKDKEFYLKYKNEIFKNSDYLKQETVVLNQYLREIELIEKINKNSDKINVVKKKKL